MKTIKPDYAFVKFIREFVTDKLFENEGLCSYGCDLAFELDMEENNNGFVTSQDDALEFFNKYPRAFLATIDWIVGVFGAEELAHAAKSWQTFAFYVLHFGVENMVNQLPFVEENWDDEFELDENAIAILIEQVKTAGIEY